MAYQSEVLAKTIFESLVGAGNANLPEIDLYSDLLSVPWEQDNPIYTAVEKLTPETVTSREVGGTGVFDAMMAGLDAHLKEQFTQGRISATDYTKAYVALTQTALEQAVQFSLGRDQAFWQAARAQAEAITARVNNETAKLEAMLRRANYALTKLKLASEDAAFGAAEYQTKHLLPEQVTLIHEQAEAQAAQTLDARLDDGLLVKGLIGQQKKLYEEQRKTYEKDIKLKSAKMFMDNWIARKTIDEGVQPNRWFGTLNGSMDAVFREAHIIATGELEPITPPDVNAEAEGE